MCVPVYVCVLCTCNIQYTADISESRGRRNAEHGSPTSKTSFKCPRLGSICSERPSVCKPDRQDDDGMFIQRIIRPSAPSPVTL